MKLPNEWPEKTNNTDGKTYHANHPDVIRDKTIDDCTAALPAVIEEAKREERERIIHSWNIAEQRLDGTTQGAVNAIEQFRNFLTSPTDVTDT